MRKKALIGLLSSLVLALGMSCIVLASNYETSSGLIREVLTSADGEPFIAEFNPETGIILFYEMNGDLFDWYQDNETEDSFWHLVRANYILTNPVFCSETGVQLLRNTSVYDYLARTIREYDMDGNVTVTSFDDKMITLSEHDDNGNLVEVALSYGEFHELRVREAYERLQKRNESPDFELQAPRSTSARGIIELQAEDMLLNESSVIAIQPLSLGSVWRGTHHTPPSNNPSMGPPIGGRWFTSPTNSRFFDVYIQSSIPSNMQLHAYFTNQARTYSTTRMNFGMFTWHNIRHPGQPYQARMTATMPGMGGTYPITTELAFW